MARVVRRPQATRDLLDIWIYVSDRGGKSRANDLIRTLRNQISLLSEQPLMGRARDELRPGLRSMPVSHYLIIYYPLEDGVEIVRVISGRQDLGAIVGEQPDDEDE